MYAIRSYYVLDLETAWLENGEYAPEILSAFDANKNGFLDESELRIDTVEKQTLLAKRMGA